MLSTESRVSILRVLCCMFADRVGYSLTLHELPLSYAVFDKDEVSLVNLQALTPVFLGHSSAELVLTSSGNLRVYTAYLTAHRLHYDGNVFEDGSLALAVRSLFRDLEEGDTC